MYNQSCQIDILSFGIRRILSGDVNDNLMEWWTESKPLHFILIKKKFLSKVLEIRSHLVDEEALKIYYCSRFYQSSTKMHFQHSRGINWRVVLLALSSFEAKTREQEDINYILATIFNVSVLLPIIDQVVCVPDAVIRVLGDLDPLGQQWAYSVIACRILIPSRDQI